MIEYWRKGTRISITNTESIDISRSGSFIVSSPPESVTRLIVYSLLDNNVIDPTSLVMSDSPFLSQHHHGSVLYAHDVKNKVAMLGLMAAMSEARAESFKAQGYAGIGEYNGKNSTPLWNVIGFLTEFDDVITDDRAAGLFVEYYRKLLTNCKKTGVYAIFCSNSHGFAMSDKGKRLLQLAPIVLSSPFSNQSVAHAMGFYKASNNKGMYFRGEAFGDAYWGEEPFESISDELLLNTARKANTVLDSEEVANSVDKVQFEVFKRIDDFYEEPPHISSGRSYHAEALSLNTSKFSPDSLVSRLMMLVGSYGIDKTPTLRQIASHMNLSEDEAIAVIQAAREKYSDFGTNISGYMH